MQKCIFSGAPRFLKASVAPMKDELLGLLYPDVRQELRGNFGRNVTQLRFVDTALTLTGLSFSAIKRLLGSSQGDYGTAL